MTNVWDTQAMQRRWPELLAAVQAQGYAWVLDEEGYPEHGAIGVSGPSAELHPGVINSEALSHYSHGNCALLALALADEAPGSTLVLCVRSWAKRPYTDETWCHLLVRLASGQLVDIHGVREAEQVTRSWESFHSVREPVHLVDIDREEAISLCGDPQTAVDAVERELARTFAITLLRAAEGRPQVAGHFGR